MPRVGLQTVSRPEGVPGPVRSGGASLVRLCSVLLLLLGTAAARPGRRGGPRTGALRCLIAKRANERWVRLQERYRSNETVEAARACVQNMPRASGKCEQAIRESRDLPLKHRGKNRRALSPWELSLDRDEDRLPQEISTARCLCEGCIIDGEENHSFNSVPVCSQMIVLRREKCPHNPDRYVITKDVIIVPVACTCVRPKY